MKETILGNSQYKTRIDTFFYKSEVSAQTNNNRCTIKKTCTNTCK